MWIWWIVSLLVLIACFIFAYRMIVSSYKFLPGDKSKLYGTKFIDHENMDIRTGEMISLKSKLQKMEENSSLYEIQISKLIQRIKVLEEIQNRSSDISKKQDEEDWKELYYEEIERKEKLENSLDEIKQKLEDAENKLNTIEDNNSKWVGLQSEHDARLNDLHAMQDHIGLLQRQLDAAADREKELEQSLESAIQVENKYIRLQNDHIRLQSENEELKRQVIEMNNREKNMEADLLRLHELESKLTLYEEEKAKMIAILKLK